MPDIMPSIGHNGPPGPPTTDTVRAYLDDQYPALKGRVAEMRQTIEAFLKKTPLIRSESEQGKAAEIVRAAKAAQKTAEEGRTREKKPYDAAGKEVTAFFGALSESLSPALTRLTEAMNVFALAQAEEARKAAAAEAARKQAEADAAAKAAARNMDATMLDRAARAAAEAEDAAELANARPAEHSRSRGDYGAVASLRRTWKVRAIDLQKLPLAYHLPDQVKLNQALRSAPKDEAGRPIFDVAGTEVYADDNIAVR